VDECKPLPPGAPGKNGTAGAAGKPGPPGAAAKPSPGGGGGSKGGGGGGGLVVASFVMSLMSFMTLMGRTSSKKYPSPQLQDL
jgi:hypothetical protein